METSEDPKRPPDAVTKSATFSEVPSRTLDPELDQPEPPLAEGTAFPAVFGQQEGLPLGLVREHDGPLAPGHGAVGYQHTLRLALAFHLWDTVGDLGTVAILLGHRDPRERGSRLTEANPLVSGARTNPDERQKRSMNMSTTPSRRTNRCIGMTNLGLPCTNPVSGSNTLCGRCATSLAGLEPGDADRLKGFSARPNDGVPQPVSALADDTAAAADTPVERVAETAKAAAEGVNSDVRATAIAAKPVDPLFLDDIEMICIAAAQPRAVSLRDAAIVMSVTQPSNDLSAAHMASLLSPSQIQILDDGTRALLWVSRTSGGRLVPVQILSEADARICPVRAFVALLAAHVPGRPLLVSGTDGRQLSRLGAWKIIRRRATAFVGSAAIDGTMKLAAEARMSMAELIYEPSADTLRDMALITNQYWAARRGAQIAVRRMRNVEVTEEGVVWHIDRIKTDPVGKGYTVGAPADKDSLACPAGTLEAWLKRYRLLLGRESRGDDPVFSRLDRAGHLSEPISRAAVAAIIQRRAAAAGLTGDYGAHSLRSGFVTDAIHNQVSVFKIAKQGGWRSVKSLDRHYRRSGTFGISNPATDKQRRRKERNVAGHAGVPAEGKSAEDRVEAELPEDPTEAASP